MVQRRYIPLTRLRRAHCWTVAMALCTSPRMLKPFRLAEGFEALAHLTYEAHLIASRKEIATTFTPYHAEEQVSVFKTNLMLRTSSSDNRLTVGAHFGFWNKVLHHSIFFCPKPRSGHPCSIADLAQLRPAADASLVTALPVTTFWRMLRQPKPLLGGRGLVPAALPSKK
eukprot:gnl/TRDRNA2_/TRDRNA2_43425_c0_seq2.p2 gnl/TRDRNA2_/TRDRNA2_43425_c0~~gnl/TRDRNA2_/TRDRNA2_43425_c0_seq2.p2  ORF type:complete len:170 (-),score=23.33 gnl/TRDRNA2_/TRDRNA2_43425_c0_seq2:92-601(-)